MPRTRADVYKESTAPLSEEQLQEILQAFQQRFERLNDQYLRMMGEHIKEIGQLWPSDVHRLQQIRRMNNNLKRLERKIAEAADASIEDIEDIFNRCAASDVRMAAKILGLPDSTTLKGNPYLEKILEAQYRETAGTMRNLSNTTVVSSFYRRAVDEAVQAVQSGTEDYNSAIRRVIREAGCNGLRVTEEGTTKVDYESGYSRRLDSAARMNVLDGLRHMNQNMLNALGDQFGANGVEIDAHMLCAEDHLPYQGQQYSDEEFQDIQDSLDRPFGEWYCRHSWHRIILGVSPRLYSDSKLEEMKEYSREKIEIDGEEKTRYEWSQVMRRVETSIRQQKDTANLARYSGDTALRKKCQGNILRLNRYYDQVSGESGLKPEYQRQYVAGFKDVKLPEQRLTTNQNSGNIKNNSRDSKKKETKNSNGLFENASFATDQLRDVHAKKHLAEYGDISTEQYVEMARNLLQAEPSDDIKTLVRSDGSISKYRVSTNEFVVGTADGNIRTAFKPNEGTAYWEYEIERNRPLPVLREDKS